MHAASDNSRREAHDLLPVNLGDWIDGKVLLDWIFEDLERLGWSNPELVRHLQNHPEHEPKRLLALMMYAYLTGTFSAEAITRLGTGDERLYNPSRHPSSGMIRRFRRENRPLLKFCLAHILQRAVQSHFSQNRLPLGMKTILVENALSRLILARDADSEPDD